MSYTPLANNAKQLHVALGYVNTVCNVTGGTALVLNVADGFTLSAADIGRTIQAFGAGPAGVPLWTTIAAVGGANNATLHDAAAADVYSVQAVIYREIPQTETGGAALLAGTADFQSSLTVRSTFNFSAFSRSGSFVPIPGMPVLVTHDVLGDIFGGMIQQATPNVYPATAAVQTDCQCVDWTILLSRANLRLRSISNPSTTDSLAGDGSSLTFHVLHIPLSVSNMTVNGLTTWGGLPVDWAEVGAGGTAMFYWDPTSSQIIQSPGTVVPVPPLGPTDHLEVTYTFLAALQYVEQQAGTIVASLGALVASDGIAVTAITGPLVDVITFREEESIDQVLNDLCGYISNGTNNYWYYMDARRGLHFEQQGVTRAAPWNLDISDGSIGNALIQIGNANTLEKYLNAAAVSVGNSVSETQYSDRFNGDGATRSFNLTFACAGIDFIFYYSTGSTPANQVSETFGIVGDPITGTGRQWYWTPGATSIVQDSLQPVLQTTDFIIILYHAQTVAIQSFPDTVPSAAMQGRQAIEGGSGEWDSYQKPANALPVISGANLAENLVGYFSTPSQGVKMQTYRGGLASGQSIIVNYPPIAGPGTYVVDSVRMSGDGNILLWDVTLLAGAVVGDWRTAFKGLTGTAGNSLTALPGGNPGGGGGAGYNVLAIITATVTPDLSYSVQEVNLNAPTCLVNTPTKSVAGMLWHLILVQDGTGGRLVTFSAAGYAGASTLAGMLSTAPSTYSSLTFVVRDDSKSAIVSVLSGIPTT